MKSLKPFYLIACVVGTVVPWYFFATFFGQEGFNVIANVRLNGADSIPWALAGIPDRATLAIGIHGCIRSLANRPHVVAEVKMICDNCQPSDLVEYGSDAYRVLDHPRERGIRVHVFTADTWCRSTDRRTA